MPCLCSLRRWGCAVISRRLSFFFTCSQLTRLEVGRDLPLLLRGRPVRGLREDLVADPDLALLDDAGEPAALAGTAPGLERTLRG